MLTCIDTSDNVSLLRTGAVWDPRFLSLFQPGDQIRLGDGVSWHGEKQRAAVAVPAGPALTPEALSSTPQFLSSSFPEPALLPPCSTLENPTFPSL